MLFLFVVIFQLFFKPDIRLGLITSLLIFLVAILCISKKQILINTLTNKLVIVYLIYNSISLLWFIFDSIPVSVFWAEWSNSILPIIFFYFPSFKNRNDNKFYKVTLFVLIISFIIAFFLWISDSQLYRNFMDVTEGPGTDMFFFQSLYGLTATGALGVIGFLIASHIFLQSHGKHGKISMLICIASTILTFRRSALAVLFFSLIIIIYIGFIKYRFIKRRFFIFVFIFIIFIYKYLANNYTDFLENLIERTQMISEAFDERSNTWGYAFDKANVLIGGGLGAFGHKAIGYNNNLIPDGNYFKLFAELGVIGFSFFLLIIGQSLKNGLQNFRENYLETIIVIALCIMSIGSNIFTYQSIAPIFWYSIGRLSLSEIKVY